MISFRSPQLYLYAPWIIACAKVGIIVTLGLEFRSGVTSIVTSSKEATTYIAELRNIFSTGSRGITRSLSTSLAGLTKTRGIETKPSADLE